MLIKRLSVLALSFFWTSHGLGQTVDVGTEDQIAAGKVLYDKNCSQCHGDTGKGDGIAARFVKPKPRDFTRGKYKIRRTPTGALPTHQDLADIIRNGMPYTTMPAWPEFSDSEVNNMVYYLKTFNASFADPERQDPPIEIPSPPSVTAESVARGREVYVELGCVRCHGDQGRGDGLAARDQTDDWGFHLRPADLTKPWTFRGGSERQVVYRTFMTGINGTAMPSYADPATLAPEDRWPLVDYVFSLSGSNEPEYSSLVSAVPAADEVSMDKGVAQFSAAPVARFPVIGQIIESGRALYPSAVDVEVRSVYDDENIAILVEWNDIHAETTGTNDPSLVAVQFDGDTEDAFERIGPDTAAAAGDDPFGDDPFADEESADPFAEESAAPAQGRSTEWSDAIAIQFPAEKPTGSLKPYFIFGDAQKPAEIWFADLANQRPQVYSARGSVSINPSESLEPFEFSASYEEGRWSAIFLRTRSSRRSFSFEEGEFLPIAFSVWDGFNHERGNKRGLTSWFSLYLEPMDKPSPIGPMVRNALVVLMIQVLIVFGVRRKFAQSDGEDNGAKEEVRA